MIGWHIKLLWGYFYYLLFLRGNLVSPQINIYCHSYLNFPKGNKFPWNLKKWIVGIFRSMAGVPYVLILKFDYQHLIEVLGIFSFYLVFLTKRLIFPQNIFPGQSFVKRSQIKNSLQTENLSIDHKVGLHAYISDNLSSQISELVSKSGQSQKD